MIECPWCHNQIEITNGECPKCNQRVDNVTETDLEVRCGLNQSSEGDETMLYIFSGLPGTGKTTLASALATKLSATYLRVDVVEQAMRDAGKKVEGPEGYMVCYAIASQNLQLGLDVIADTVNPIEITRQAWRNVAASLGIPFVEIEVICSDVNEHRHRVVSRTADIPGFVQPTWEQVRNREYDIWDRDHIVIDTAHQTVVASLNTLFEKLEVKGGY